MKALKQEEINTKKKDNIRILKNILKEGEDVLSKHNSNTDDIHLWNVKDITKVLRTYRTKDDKPIPTKKKDVIDLFHTWKQRPVTKYNGKVVVDITDEDNVIITTTAAHTPEPLVMPNEAAASSEDNDIKIPSLPNMPVEAKAGASELQLSNITTGAPVSM